MKKDPVVERIRKIKRTIAKEFDYDLHKFAEYIMKKQVKSKNRLVNTLKVIKNKKD